MYNPCCFRVYITLYNVSVYFSLVLVISSFCVYVRFSLSLCLSLSFSAGCFVWKVFPALNRLVWECFVGHVVRGKPQVKCNFVVYLIRDTLSYMCTCCLPISAYSLFLLVNRRRFSIYPFNLLHFVLYTFPAHLNFQVYFCSSSIKLLYIGSIFIL